MDGTGPHHPLSDSQLDRELESALGIEPSPEFLARVRTRIVAEPEASAWRLALWGRGLQPVVVAGIAAVVMAVVVTSVMRNREESVPQTVARQVEVPVPERVADLPPVAGDRVAAPGPQQMARVARRVEADVYVGPAKGPDAVPAVALQLSQPLFSEDERRAIFQFAVAVEEGRVPPVPVGGDSEQSSVTRKMNIEPLVIDPLPQLARVQTQGEGQW